MSTSRTLRAGWQIATEHPSLILWYLRNRLRTATLPLERALATGYSLAPRFITLKPTLRCNLRSQRLDHALVPELFQEPCIRRLVDQRAYGGQG